MKLMQELMGLAPEQKQVTEATGKYQSSFHPKEAASSVKEFRKFLEALGYTSEDGDYKDVKYLGFKDHNYVYLLLALDNNEDEWMISKFFASFDGDAKLTGDFAGNVMHTFAKEDEDDAQDKFDSINTTGSID